MRYRNGLFSKEARPQKRVNITLADQAEVGAFKGTRVSVDGTNDKLMPIPTQFHVRNFTTGKDEVYFLPEIKGLALPEQHYGRPGVDGKKGTWQCRVVAMSEDAHDTMVAELKSAGINFTPGVPYQLPEYMETETPTSLLVEINYEIDNTHKRAVAKILMNFIAFYLGRDESLRSRWNFLRRYVRYAEGEIKARLSKQPFRNSDEANKLGPPERRINIRIENLNGNIIGAVQFYNTEIIEMIISENEKLSQNNEFSYAYIYNNCPIIL